MSGTSLTNLFMIVVWTDDAWSKSRSCISCCGVEMLLSWSTLRHDLINQSCPDVLDHLVEHVAFMYRQLRIRFVHPGRASGRHPVEIYLLMRGLFDKAIWVSTNIEEATVACWLAHSNEWIISSKPQVPPISKEVLDKQQLGVHAWFEVLVCVFFLNKVFDPVRLIQDLKSFSK